MKNICRREFLAKTTKTALGVVSFPYFISSSALGKAGTVAASERITMGVVGTGVMGTFDIRGFLTCPDVRILAVCDVETQHRQQAKSLVDSHYGNSDCAEYNDFREILARDDIDTVLIATPDHWHALISIAAAKAGKDIYCEKPISLTIAEGRAVADAMKRYGTVYQSGTQRRSVECFRFGVDVARSGVLGKLHTMHAHLGGNPTCGPEPEYPVPEGFDYDMWLGQAPAAPFTWKRCHGSFRFIYDYSGGTMTDVGSHFVDLIQWGNDSEHTGPIEYEGRGEFPRDGLWNMPTNYEVNTTYADGKKLILHSTYPWIIKFEGTDGWISVEETGIVDAEPKSILQARKFQYHSWSNMQGHPHHRDFLNCVKTRASTIAPPEVAHRSTTICHISNLCLRIGRKLKWDPQTERFIGDEQANHLLSRAMRSPWHL